MSEKRNYPTNKRAGFIAEYTSTENILDTLPSGQIIALCNEPSCRAVITAPSITDYLLTPFCDSCLSRGSRGAA